MQASVLIKLPQSRAQNVESTEKSRINRETRVPERCLGLGRANSGLTSNTTAGKRKG